MKKVSYAIKIGIAIISMIVVGTFTPPVRADDESIPPRGMELFNEVNRIRTENNVPPLVISQV